MSSVALPAPSHTPTYGRPYHGYDPFYDPFAHPEEQECPVGRTAAGVQWSLTATYLAVLIAYAQLQLLQGEKSGLKIAYKLVILVIFPLYPICSLLVEVFRSLRAWRSGGQHNHMFFLSRIIGLRVSQPGASSQALQLRHLAQYSCVSQQRRIPVTAIHGLVLMLASTQCLGTFIRTTARLFIGAHHPPTMHAFSADDFESFYLSMGSLAVLTKSWAAYLLNIEWKRDHGIAADRLDISSRTEHQRTAGIFAARDSHLSPSEIISEIFLEFQTRALALLGLFVIFWIVLAILANRVLIVFAAWACVAVLSFAWLRRSEAEEVPGGKEVFVSGFCACFIFLAPRVKFYLSRRWYTGVEEYWGSGVFPWPLAVLIVIFIARLVILHRYDLPYSSVQSKMSHICLVALGVFLLIILPAYVCTAGFFSETHYSYWDPVWDCPGELLADPFWVPSL